MAIAATISSYRSFVQDLVRTIMTLANLFRDLLIELLIMGLPVWMVSLIVQKGDFASLVNPRDLQAILVKWILRDLWPVVAGRVTWVRAQRNGKHLSDHVVVCPRLAMHMFQNTRLARARILQTARFAERLGCSVVGLGALLPRCTDRGRLLLDKVRVAVTTGHAYTTVAVLETVQRIAGALRLNLPSATVAIVGAAGSIGSLCARSLAEWKLGALLLVDQPGQRGVLAERAGSGSRCLSDLQPAGDFRTACIYPEPP